MLYQILLIGCLKNPATQPANPNAEIISQHEVDAVEHTDNTAPTKTTGVKSVEPLGSILLANEWPEREVTGLEMRARKLTLNPDAVVAQHSHEARPGFAVMISGEAIEHRNDSDGPLKRLVGDHSVERPGITHWWENRSGAELSAVVIDIVPTETVATPETAAEETHSSAVKTQGVEVVELERTALGVVQESLAGLDFRLRKITVSPGGTVGAHVHQSRPGMVLLLSGQLTEHRGKNTPVTHTTGALYQKRVLLQAQIRFFSHEGKLDSSYTDWMRVVRNIVQQATIDTPESFMGAIRLVNELSRGTRDIYAHLAVSPIESKFAEAQVNEEIRKAIMLQEHPEQKEILQELEDLPFCQGRISFALYCSSKDAAAIEPDFEELAKVRDVIKRYFSAGITTELRRALFTIGDGRFYHYWKSYLYAINVPKYCAIEDTEDLRGYAYNYSFRDYLKQLVIYLSDVDDVADLLRSYQPSKETPNWMLRIIKEPGLMDASTNGYFTVSEDDKVCHLIPRKRVAVSDKGIDQLVEVR